MKTDKSRLLDRVVEACPMRKVSRHGFSTRRERRYAPYARDWAWYASLRLAHYQSYIENIDSLLYIQYLYKNLLAPMSSYQRGILRGSPYIPLMYSLRQISESVPSQQSLLDSELGTWPLGARRLYELSVAFSSQLAVPRKGLRFAQLAYRPDLERAQESELSLGDLREIRGAILDTILSQLSVPNWTPSFARDAVVEDRLQEPKLDAVGTQRPNHRHRSGGYVIRKCQDRVFIQIDLQIPK